MIFGIPKAKLWLKQDAKLAGKARKLDNEVVDEQGGKMKQEQKTQVVEQARNLPEKKFRAGAICATVWKNQFKAMNGEVREYNTVSFERGYKDKTGVWKSTNSLRFNDLPKAAMVLGEAYKYLALNEQENSAAEAPVEEEVVY